MRQMGHALGDSTPASTPPCHPATLTRSVPSPPKCSFKWATHPRARKALLWLWQRSCQHFLPGLALPAQQTLPFVLLLPVLARRAVVRAVEHDVAPGRLPGARDARLVVDEEVA